MNFCVLSSKSCKCGSQTGAAYPMWGCIYIVGEVFPGQRAGRNDDTIGPRFSLIWCMLLQYVLTKTGQM